MLHLDLYGSVAPRSTGGPPEAHRAKAASSSIRGNSFNGWGQGGTGYSNFLNLPEVSYQKIFTVCSQSSRFYLLFLFLGTLRTTLKQPGLTRGQRPDNFPAEPAGEAKDRGTDLVRGRTTQLSTTLTPGDKTLLESWQRSTTIQAGLARRGRIILLMSEGASISHISRTVGIRRRFIYKWVERFQSLGVSGLSDKPGRGRVSQIPNGFPQAVSIAV